MRVMHTNFHDGIHFLSNISFFRNDIQQPGYTKVSDWMAAKFLSHKSTPTFPPLLIRVSDGENYFCIFLGLIFFDKEFQKFISELILTVNPFFWTGKIKLLPQEVTR